MKPCFRFIFWILGYCSMSDKYQQFYKLHFPEKKSSNFPDCRLWHKLNLRSRFSWVLRAAGNIYWAFAASQNFAASFMKMCSFDHTKALDMVLPPPHELHTWKNWDSGTKILWTVILFSEPIYVFLWLIPLQFLLPQIIFGIESLSFFLSFFFFLVFLYDLWCLFSSKLSSLVEITEKPSMKVQLPLSPLPPFRSSALQNPLSKDAVIPITLWQEGREQQNSPRVKTLWPWEQLEGQPSLIEATFVQPMTQRCLCGEEKLNVQSSEASLWRESSMDNSSCLPRVP